MGTESHVTSPFIINHDWPDRGKSALGMLPLNKYSLMMDPSGIYQVPELFVYHKTAQGVPQTESVSSNNC